LPKTCGSSSIIPLEGTESPEFVALKAADEKVVDKNLACNEITRKNFVQ
jgi:hypothetical protein